MVKEFTKLQNTKSEDSNDNLRHCKGINHEYLHLLNEKGSIMVEINEPIAL